MKFLDIPEKHIPLIMEIIDNIVSADTRIRKYTDRQMLKILILLQISGISYRSSEIFLSNHQEYLALCNQGDTVIPDIIKKG